MQGRRGVHADHLHVSGGPQNATSDPLSAGLWGRAERPYLNDPCLDRHRASVRADRRVGARLRLPGLITLREMAHGPGDSEYELRRARSMCPSAARISAGCGWPWVSGRPSRGSARTPALNANHARQTQRRFLGRSLTFPARTAPTVRRSLCAYEAAYGDSRPDGAAGGHN